MNLLRKIKKLVWSYLYSIKVLFLFFRNKNRNKTSHDLSSQLIISLTSFPARYKTLHLTLKCLLIQTVKVDKIILWIAYDDYKSLPKSVLDLQDYGLTILKTEDIRSYKKIIPTLELYPDSYIITVDDDLYFPMNMVDNLVSKYKENTNCVIANRTHVMKFDKNNKLEPYMKWDLENSLYNFFTSGAGTLFPPNTFYKDICNRSIFLKLSPFADDIWLNFMTKMNNCNIIYCEKHFKLISWPFSQDFALSKNNITENDINNDVQIKEVLEYYKLKLIEGI